MLIRCPLCHSKARIAASEQLTSSTRYIYIQCLNIRCSGTFRGYLEIQEIIKAPDTGSQPPDPTKQPELANNPDQMDIFGETTEYRLVSEVANV
ncbi:ogr/Delta-like zinc finger family protein [Hydrogenovibrio marinus]|uniref:Zinc finger Ogr/Delta-type domain-containing protein n=1 Tax=Hydrogenovibrio marinus TaxID=28885 RepID=A0A066ZWW8_HYDMR|nr:hypothetical protein EI16_00615 [Hydrogenovibrio marinus]BBN59311.1 hypothetical protein HVMH_0905 [Hydrogenovibrio marinus]